MSLEEYPVVSREIINQKQVLLAQELSKVRALELGHITTIQSVLLTDNGISKNFVTIGLGSKEYTEMVRTLGNIHTIKAIEPIEGQFN